MKDWEYEEYLNASESRFMREIEEEYKRKEFVEVPNTENKRMQMDCYRDSKGRHREMRRY